MKYSNPMLDSMISKCKMKKNNTSNIKMHSSKKMLQLIKQMLIINKVCRYSIMRASRVIKIDLYCKSLNKVRLEIAWLALDWRCKNYRGSCKKICKAKLERKAKKMIKKMIKFKFNKKLLWSSCNSLDFWKIS